MAKSFEANTNEPTIADELRCRPVVSETAADGIANLLR